MPSPNNDQFIAKRLRLSPAATAAPGAALSEPGDFPEPPVEPADSDGEALRAQREDTVRVALANGSLTTVLQPIVDLREGETVGVEALTRFSEPPPRPPTVWFAEAASVDLLVELELTALRMALEQLHRLPADLYLSLNASVETIVSEEFLATLADAPGERLVVELTEHTEVRNYKLLEEASRNLRSTGLRLAIDSTGAGYSNLRHILNLQPDFIKLDIELTRGIDKDQARRALASALLAFGRDAFNAGIVAEGIETEAEFETLRSIGCPFGQGFYLGRPGTVRAAPPKHALSGQLWLDEEDEQPMVPAFGRTGTVTEARTPPDEVSLHTAIQPDSFVAQRSPSQPECVVEWDPVVDPESVVEPDSVEEPDSVVEPAGQPTSPSSRRRRLRSRSKLVGSGPTAIDTIEVGSLSDSQTG